MDDNKVVPIGKNKEEDSFDDFLLKQIALFPPLEKDILSLSLGLGDPFQSAHTSEEIAEKLNHSKETIDKNLAIAMQKLSDICQKEKIREENEDAYNEIRLQMHNKLIKKLRSLKDEWKLDNTSQVVERIILAFFKNDLD